MQGATGKSKLTDANSLATELVTLPTIIHCDSCGRKQQPSLAHNRGQSASASLHQLNENSVEEMKNEVPDYADHPDVMPNKPFVISKPANSLKETHASGFDKSIGNNSPNSTKRTIQSRSRSRGTKSKSPIRKQYVNDPEWHHDKKYEDFLAGVYLKHPQHFLSSQ